MKKRRHRHKWVLDRSDLAHYILLRCEGCGDKKRLPFTTINFFEYVLLPYILRPGKLSERGKKAIQEFMAERKGILRGVNADLAKEIKKLEKTGRYKRRLRKLRRMKRFAEVASLFF